MRLAVVDGKTNLERALRGKVKQEKAQNATKRHERIRALLERQPSPDFEKEYEAAEELSHLVRLELIERLREPFNAALRERSQGDYEAKKEAAKWANDRMWRIGLAPVEPGSGLPGVLVGKVHPTRDTGRLVVEASDEGRRRVTLVDPAKTTVALVGVQLAVRRHPTRASTADRSAGERSR